MRQQRRTSVSPTERQKLTPQQRYAKRPKYPGVATFDRTLRRLPLQHTKGIVQEAHGHDVPPVPEPDNGSRTHPPSPSTVTSEPNPDIMIESEPETIVNGQVRVPPTTSEPPHNPLVFPAHVAQMDLYEILSDSSHPLRPFEPQNDDDDDDDDNDDDWYGRKEVKGRRHTNSPLLNELVIALPNAERVHREAKLIYTELLSECVSSDDVILWNETPDGQPETGNTDPSTTISTTVRQSQLSQLPRTPLVPPRLRTAMLQSSHSFFGISQSLLGPHSLQRLAIRYGSSSTTIRSAIDEFPRFIQPAIPRIHDDMLTFLSNAKSFLEKLNQLPYLAAQGHWTVVNENLHVLNHILCGAPETLRRCVYCPENKYEPYVNSDRWHKWKCFRMSPADPIDDALRDRYWREWCPVALEPVSVGEIEELYRATHRPLSSHVMFCLSGWLCYGPKIALDFHEYCKVFKYLVWFGITA